MNIFKVARCLPNLLACASALLLLSACGGNDDDSRPGEVNDASSQASVAASVSSSSLGAVSSSVSSQRPSSSSSSSSSAVGVGISSSSISSRRSASSAKSSNSSSAAPVSRDVVIEWYIPTERENGDYLELDEIGGYEIRYKSASMQDYHSVVVEDGNVDHYDLGELNGSYEFQIATFDMNGLYSEFVPINPN